MAPKAWPLLPTAPGRGVGALVAPNASFELHDMMQRALATELKERFGLRPESYDFQDLSAPLLAASVTWDSGMPGAHPNGSWCWEYDPNTLKFDGEFQRLLGGTVGQGRFFLIVGGSAGRGYVDPDGLPPSWSCHSEWRLSKGPDIQARWDVAGAHAKGLSSWSSMGPPLMWSACDNFRFEASFRDPTPTPIICQFVGMLALPMGYHVTQMRHRGNP